MRRTADTPPGRATPRLLFQFRCGHQPTQEKPQRRERCATPLEPEIATSTKDIFWRESFS